MVNSCPYNSLGTSFLNFNKGSRALKVLCVTGIGKKSNKRARLQYISLNGYVFLPTLCKGNCFYFLAIDH